MTPKQESPFHVGQEVIWYDGYSSRAGSRREITRVGRKYVYINTYGGRECAFDFQGREHRSSDAGGQPMRIATPEQDALDKQHTTLVIEAKRLGFDYRIPRYSAETLKQVIGILQADPAAPKPREEIK